MSDYTDLIADARVWPRDGVSKGPLINALADAIEALVKGSAKLPENSDEHDRQVAERAWDEGFSRGFYAGQSYPDGADASEPDIDNPYRKEQENNNA